jgi:hypothetical protein
MALNHPRVLWVSGEAVMKLHSPEKENDTLRALNAELVEALQVCDRVLHFDLRSMITWGKDYNQAVKDAADTARAAITKATGESTD